MFAPLLWLQFWLLCVAAETAEVNSVDLLLRVKRDMNDVDMTDTSSDTSSTGGQEQDLDSGDPNLHNPQPNEGYGHEYVNRYNRITWVLIHSHLSYQAISGRDGRDGNPKTHQPGSNRGLRGFRGPTHYN